MAVMTPSKGVSVLIEGLRVRFWNEMMKSKTKRLVGR